MAHFQLAAGGTGAFDDAALAFGGLLMLGALVSGIVRRSFLSLTALFVVLGFVIGPGALDLLHFDAGSGFVSSLATVALIVILFRDGLEVEAEMLQTTWHLPFRKLALAMPITCLLVAVACHLVTDLGWTASFLVAVLLTPTDPVLSSSVVTNPRVPRKIRHSLNLESGLNDGLALPAVLALAAALRVGESDFVWWKFVLQDVSVGLAFGVVIGFLAAKLMPRSRGLREGIPAHQKSLYVLGVAFVAYGAAVAPPHGNGLIAAFTCAITLGIQRPDLREDFERRSADVIEVVKLGIFVVFGALLTLHGLFTDGWAAVAIVAITFVVARPVAVFIALLRTDTDLVERGFMAWFGPKGVATMTFALIVLSDRIPNGDRIFNIAALAVFASILVHGLTDTPAAEWIGRRAGLRGESDATR